MKRLLTATFLGIVLGYVCSFTFDSLDKTVVPTKRLASRHASMALNLPKARFRLEDEMDKTDAENIFQTGLKYTSQGNIPRAIEFFKIAASRGHIPASRECGIWILNTATTPSQAIEAKTWLEAAAEKGDLRAASSLGFLYSSGRIGSADYQKSKYWLKVAADSGEVEAQHNLALQYLEGRGVAPSQSDAAYWFEKAAENGSGEASYRLAIMYQEGKGVEANENEAARWMLTAAEKNIPDAQYQLALRYKNGQDMDQARHWFKEAANRGHQSAKTELTHLPIESEEDLRD